MWCYQIHSSIGLEGNVLTQVSLRVISLQVIFTGADM